MEETIHQVQQMTQLGDPAQAWANDLLVWVGFGTLIGLLAKAIMPGRDPGGAIATLAMGIGGVIIGCGVYSLSTDGSRITPVSPLGIVVATAGAFSLLFFYRLLGGYWIQEGEVPPPRHMRRRRVRRRRRYATAYYDE